MSGCLRAGAVSRISVDKPRIRAPGGRRALRKGRGETRRFVNTRSPPPLTPPAAGGSSRLAGLSPFTLFITRSRVYPRGGIVKYGGSAAAAAA